MITVTGNATYSIALRNAILKVVPAPYVDPISMKNADTLLSAMLEHGNDKDNSD